MSQEYDWSRFRVRINIDASVQSIYEAWTSQEMLELWLLRLVEFTGKDRNIRDRFHMIQESDQYRWLWHGYDDNTAETGTILKANGLDLVKFTFGRAGNCTVTVREVSGENVLEMVQEDIPIDEKGKQHFHIGCRLGWTFYLANLKSLLEGGIDLRNRNEQLKGMMNS